MAALIRIPANVVRKHWRLWLVTIPAGALLYYVSLLAFVSIRLHELPNYWVAYDFPSAYANI